MNENEENNHLDGKAENPFSLPGDYFGSFSKKMLHKIELAEEIKEFKILSAIDKRLPFVTPGNYFAKNANSAEVKAELSGYETLSALERENTFITPELYFVNSVKAIKYKIELAEELSAYPTLKTLEKISGFSAPQGYFNAISYEVRAKIVAGKNENAFGKVIRLVFDKKTAYALAAMLVLSLGLYYFNNDTKVIIAAGDCQGLACLDKKDIHENQLLHMDEESLMEAVNPEKLSKNLKENVSSTPAENDSDKKQKEDYVIENTDVNDIVDGI